MNKTFSRVVAFSCVLLPIAFVAHAQNPTPTPKPAKTPKPTRTPRPTKTPKPTATPRATPTNLPAPIPVSATDGSNGRTLFVAEGGILELRLASNPSTGYSWNVVSNQNLQLEGDPQYEATPSAPAVVGSGGFTVFRFRAIKHGTGDLALDLHAPGSATGDAADKTFRATVKVLKAIATPPSTPATSPVTVSATEKDNGKTLSVKRGDLLELTLATNPSTGYGWYVISNSHLKLEGDPQYQATPTDPGIVGSGGFTTYRFRAVKTGTGALALDLRAPGYKSGDKPAETYRATVEVIK